MSKLLTELETRQKLLRFARRIGAEADLRHLFDKWDKLIALSPLSEKFEMVKMAILEVQDLLDIHAEENEGLTINGEVIVPAKINNV
ncbi:MAG: hypothetical protein WC516_08345 [Patescibacteria group bacterium]|jgi:hypothetical protein